MLRAVINYSTHEFPEGVSILDALRALKVEVPALCHDDRLKDCGSRRMCLVSVKGIAHPVAACTTRLEGGMVIESHAPELEDERRTLLREVAEHYPADAVHKAPGAPFHHWLLHYGLEGDCLGSHQPELADDSHPYIHVDMSQCITCYRCARSGPPGAASPTRGLSAQACSGRALLKTIRARRCCMPSRSRWASAPRCAALITGRRRRRSARNFRCC
jgi:predicted molibdopterin-dependent oxidoreductase YjgC